jgi:penicillin amidase
VHLSAPGWNVIGGGEPEIPGVSIGHNQYGAWGLTIFETDAEDLYVYDINPSNPLQYKFQGAWRDMKKTSETIKIKNRKDTTVDLFFTHHGPITYIDKNNHKAYAIKCAWLEPGGAPYLASLRIDQATDWNSFRDGCSYSHIPGENMIWADKKGNIGWQAVGITPIRTTHSGMIPVPGDGKYEWNGYLPIKDRPHVYNPSNGYFTTSNQHVTPTTYPFMKTISYTWADDFRGDRIKDVLEKENTSTIEQSMALQTDYVSLPSRKLIPLIMEMKFNDQFINQSRDSLQKWNNVLDKNSIAASIYIMWEREISEQAKKQFVPNSISGYITLQMSTILKWMIQPNVLFKESAIQNRDEFLKTCFINAINKLKNKLGNDISKWQYGQSNFKHIFIKHPLSDLVDEKMRQELNFGPIARGGYGYSPGANGMADNQTAGASFRMVADLSDWDKAVFTNTPGQSSDPQSPFYKNLFEDWANDKFFPALYSKNKIETAAFKRTQLLPLK